MVRHNASHEKDTNIQVVVRCREAPTRGAKSNTSVIVPPVFGQDVKITGSPSVARSFHFDGVFGPKASQENIYDKVVSPILNEVMQGFNCTLFAYGQTGTGKTYTMEGDLDSTSTPAVSRVPTPTVGHDLLSSARMSPQAGMIPRTLHNLFYALDKQSAEYYVHVSYVELYNEELRDLLAGTDHAGDTNGFVPSGNLRVYESGTDKGVVIQGLEEKLVTSAKDAVALMQAGAMRRKVAATRCNDTSSRSHAIFTITVFVRERAVTVDGEDVSKLGKLNLVDLAGSENIGRSGAQNVRAREAGSINKSLLVLGRVINALVEKATFVPYRDSKLTHIIKDSLGGRTRTCMIATISNAVDHIEETVKTLQYASQAKGIRNRPVANKMVLKSEIVHDLQQHIERLNRDLEAARDNAGTGFYVSKDTYEELTTQAKASREIAEEWKQRVALWEEEVQRTNDKMRVLSNEHAATCRELSSTNETLNATREQLDVTQSDLQRQTLLTRAHAHHERALNAAAFVLQASARTSAGDAQALHAKTARMAEREQHNIRAAALIGESVRTEVERAQASAVAYSESAARQSQQLLHALQSRVGPEFEAALDSCLRQHASTMEADIAKAVQTAQTQRSEAQNNCQRIAEQVDTIASGLDTVVADKAAQGAAISTQLNASVEKHSAEQKISLATITSAIGTVLDTCASSTAKLLSESQQRAQQIIDELRTEADMLRARHAEEIRELREQAQKLSQQARTEDDDFMAAVRNMVEQRRTRNDAAIGGLLDSADSQASARAQSTARLVDQTAAVSASLDHAAAAVLSAAGDARQTIGTKLADGQTTHERISSVLSAAVVDHTTQLNTHFSAVVEATASAHSELSAATQQSQQTVAQLCQSSSLSLDHITSRATACARALQTTTTDAMQEWRDARTEMDALVCTQASERDAFAAELRRGISEISTVVVRETSTGILATQPNGTTPRSRRYQSIDSWNVTRPHAQILAQLLPPSDVSPDTDALEWTGMLATDPESESVQPMAMSPVSTAFSSPVRPDSSLLRKRSSDTAVSPASDPATERPTRRPKTQTNGDTDMGENGSALPSANNGVSRLPMPSRRSRRTRG
ncbi:hypothetical protein GGH12_004031 [Coemansia sp. RSA 1822]|nr:hypothetical protein GGH12_004031 [Coemansia sp. RSA 1822]